MYSYLNPVVGDSVKYNTLWTLTASKKTKEEDPQLYQLVAVMHQFVVKLEEDTLIWTWMTWSLVSELTANVAL